MKVTLNLARRPPENLRRTWLVWGTTLAVAFAALLVLSLTCLTRYQTRRVQMRRIHEYQVRMAPLQREIEAGEAEVATSESKRALRQAIYLNRLIDAKAVSWTTLFEQLEAIMPPQVQLVSLRPLEVHGHTAVDMLVAAPTELDALTFARAIESSNAFSDPRIRFESRSQAERTRAAEVRLEVTADYAAAPGPAPAAHSLSAPAEAEVDTNTQPDAAGDATPPARPRRQPPSRRGP